MTALQPPIDKNNFDGVRIGLAIIVVIAHLAALTQLPQLTPLASFFDANFAVKGFFTISGFLVMQSYTHSTHMLDYAQKRIRRIYPGYLAAIMLCVLIGAAATTLDITAFFTSSQTIRYLLANAAFLNFLQPELPSTFVGNPVQAMNGALWTIKVEAMLYCCIPVIGFLFKRLGSAKVTLAILLASAGWVYYFTVLYHGSKGEEIARQFPGQLGYFTIGALLYVNEALRAKTGWLALVSTALLYAISNDTAKLLIQPVCYASVVIYLATSACTNLHCGKYGDISYGLYLYHFPIIQMLVYMGVFSVNIWLGLALTTLGTLACALASWHLLEKRLLKRSSHYVVATQH